MDFKRILSVASALEPEKAPVRPICVLAGKFILFHLAEVSHVLGDTQVPSPAFWGRGGLRGCRWEEAEAGGHVVPARGMHTSRESQIPDLLSTGEYMHVYVHTCTLVQVGVGVPMHAHIHAYMYLRYVYAHKYMYI